MEASMEEIPLEDEDSESIEFRVLMAFAQRNLSASRYQEFLKQISLHTGNETNGGPLPQNTEYAGGSIPPEASLHEQTSTSDNKKCRKKKTNWRQRIVPSCIQGNKEKDDTGKSPARPKKSKKKVPVETKPATESPPTQPEEDDRPVTLHHIADRLVEILHDATNTVENRTLRRSFSVEADGGIDEDQIIQGIVALLRESGDRLNEKIQADKSLCQGVTEVFTSYSSFKKLADQYLGDVVPKKETEAQQQSVKVAATMDITTRLTAIDHHPMNKLLGFGVKYLKENFSPWIQNQGGWEKALGVTDQEEVE